MRLERLEATRAALDARNADPYANTPDEMAAGLSGFYLAMNHTEGDAAELDELRALGILDPSNFVRKTKAGFARFYAPAFPSGECENEEPAR
jgi:hypothetical protein